MSRYDISEQVVPVAVAFQPGMQFFRVWGTPDEGATIGPRTEPRLTSFFPGPGGTRAIVIRFPPPSKGTPAFDMGAGADERESLRLDAESKLPGLFHAHESDEDDPGFHSTETIDYVVVLEGNLVLEQDSREAVQLAVGDWVVQRGTNHRWSNPGPGPAAMGAILIGVRA